MKAMFASYCSSHFCSVGVHHLEHGGYTQVNKSKIKSVRASSNTPISGEDAIFYALLKIFLTI